MWQSLIIDDNGLVWYNNDWDQITNFSFYPRSEVYQAWGSILHREGSIFIVGDPGVDVLKNGLVESFDDFPYE
jgi:hypothetical protein